MASTTTWTIKKVGILSIATFLGVAGLVWGFLAGVIILATYVQGFLAGGDFSLIQTGLSGFVLMIVYGVLGGFIGGALVAFVYNRTIGAEHGIRIELAAKG